MTRAPLIIGLFVLIAAGCTGQQKPEQAAKPSAKDSTPAAAETAPSDVALEILDFEGLERLIASKRGKVVVLDCWSTSCQPCVKNFHHLVELHKTYGPEKVACISLSFDYEGIGRPEDVRDRVLKFLRDQGATFDNVLSSVSSDELARRIRIASIPAVFVYNRDGVLRRQFDNEEPGSRPFNYGHVAAAVNELLAEPVPPRFAELMTTRQ